MVTIREMAYLHRILLTVLFTGLVWMTLHGQERLLDLYLRDAQTGDGVEAVHVVVEGVERPWVSGADGRLSLSVSPGQVLLFSHVAYEPLRMEVLRTHWQVSPWQVRLLRRVLELPTVSIGRATPEVVYMHDALHVADFVPAEEGLWVLAYARPRLWKQQSEVALQPLRDVRLVLLDSTFAERATLELPGEALQMHRDHAGRVYVEERDKAWRAFLKEDAITLDHLTLDDLYRGVLPWTDSVPGKLIGSDRVEDFPAFAHFMYDPVNDDTRIVCSVEDEHMVALFRSEYKYMSGHNKVRAMDLGRELGVDCEIVAGIMTDFASSPYFRMPYGPLFRQGDTLLVFDHVHERLRRFDLEAREAATSPLRHAREKGWREPLLQDPVSGAVYAQFERHGNAWLCEVDTRTGDLMPPFRLGYRYPEAVQIHDGHVYYVYRPFESQQFRTLYREALP